MADPAPIGSDVSAGVSLYELWLRAGCRIGAIAATVPELQWASGVGVAVRRGQQERSVPRRIAPTVLAEDDPNEG